MLCIISYRKHFSNIDLSDGSIHSRRRFLKVVQPLNAAAVHQVKETHKRTEFLSNDSICRFIDFTNL